MPLHFITPNVPRTLAPQTIKSIYLSGLFSAIGWLFIAIGFIVFFSLLAATDARYACSAAHKWGETTATVTGVKPKYSKKKHTIQYYRYEFEFMVADKKYTNTSQSQNVQTNITSTAPIRYLLSNPNTSGIIGMRMGTMPLIIPFVMLIFPILGLLLLISNHYQKRKIIHLLQNGLVAYAQFFHKKMTNDKTNNKRHAEYSFKFEVADKTYFAKTRTPHYDTIEDEEKELILYSPENPAQNFVYEGDHWIPTINSKGEFNPDTNSGVHLLPYVGILGLFIGIIAFTISVYFV